MANQFCPAPLSAPACAIRRVVPVASNGQRSRLYTGHHPRRGRRDVLAPLDSAARRQPHRLALQLRWSSLRGSALPPRLSTDDIDPTRRSLERRPRQRRPASDPLDRRPRRQSPSRSPGLAAENGPSICFCFQYVCQGRHSRCRVSHPSRFYWMLTPPFPSPTCRYLPTIPKGV